MVARDKCGNGVVAIYGIFVINMKLTFTINVKIMPAISVNINILDKCENCAPQV